MKRSISLLLIAVIIFALSLVGYSDDTNQPAFLGGFFSRISHIFNSRRSSPILPTTSTGATHTKQNPKPKKAKNSSAPKTTSKDPAGSKSTPTSMISSPIPVTPSPTIVSASSVTPSPSTAVSGSPAASQPSTTPIPVKVSDIKNLLAYWNFDEGSGTTLYDSSPNGVSGTILNISTSKAWWDQGKIGRALELDGYDDYIYIQSLPAVDLGTENKSYSISLWVKRSGNPPYESGIISKNDGVGRYPFAITIQKDGKIAFHLYDGTNIAKIISDVPVTDNKWKHIVAVRDGTNKQLRLYINNAALPIVEDTTKGSLKNDDYILIGRYPFGDSSFYHDSFVIDETRIYGTALTDTEIKALYDFGNTKVSFFGYLRSLIQKTFSF